MTPDLCYHGSMEFFRTHKTECWITGGCAAALLACFALYLIGNPIDYWYEGVIVVCDLVLFMVVGVLFVFRWIGAWREKTPDPAAPRDGIRIFLLIFLIMALSHAVRILLAYLWQIAAFGFDSSPLDSLWTWSGSDTRHYLAIAEHWYADYDNSGTVWRLVFLPFYSILVRLLAQLTGHYFPSGMFISILSSCFAGCALYALARHDYDRETSLRAIKYCCILPAALFQTAALTESTFLLLSLLCLLGARRKNWLLAGIAGGLAAFTRSVGVILLVPAVFEWLTEVLCAEKKRAPLLWGFALLLIPAGLFGYLLINYLETGSAFTFTVLQKQNWGQQLGWFFHSVRYQLNYCLRWLGSDKRSDALGLWIPNLLAQFSALGLMAVGAKKQRPSYVAYFLIYFAVSMGTTWLLSAPRYLMVLFPLLFAMADLGRRKWVDGALTFSCLLLGQLYLYAYIGRLDVY